MLMAVLIMRTMNSADLSASFSVQQTGPQIDTIEDFLDSPLRIMITQVQKTVYFDSGLLPPELKDRLLIVKLSTLLEHMNELNTSYAYIATSWDQTVLDQRQQLLTRPIFRIVLDSQFCTSSYFLGLPVQFNSPFSESFHQFYLNTLSNGLRFKWLTRTRMYMFHIGVFTPLRDNKYPFTSLTLSDCEALINLYGLSVIYNFLSLLLEILWKRFRNMTRKCKL